MSQQTPTSKKPVWQESTCQECVFWIRKEGGQGQVGAPVVGECRRRPPSATGVAVMNQRGGIEIAGQKHQNIEIAQVACLGNYPPIGPQNPACGDFIPVAPFDKVVEEANKAADVVLSAEAPVQRKVSDR